MKVEFDIDTAQFALTCGVGSIITETDQKVTIDKWNYNVKIDDTKDYPIWGYVVMPDGMRVQMCWTSEGKYFSDGRPSAYNLYLDVPDELWL